MKLDKFYEGLEFSKEADSLIERIKQHKREIGQPFSKKDILKIANLILESRL